MHYQHKIIAVFGVSQDPSKYGYKIFTTLVEHGLAVYGINPKGGEVAGQTLYPSLDKLPRQPEVAIMVVPPAVLEQAVAQCAGANVREIWFQPGARSDAAFKQAEQAGMHALNGCFMAENGFW